LKVPYVSQDVAAGFVAEGAVITEAGPALDELLVSTAKIAVLTRMSHEAYSSKTADQIVSVSLRRSLISKADAAYVANPAGGPGPVGLVNTPGVVAGGTLAAGDSLDVVAEAVTAVEVNGGTPTHLICDPASWGVIQTLKQATGSNLPLIGAPAETTERKLFGLPVMVSAAVPAGNLLVVDQAEVMAAVSPLAVAVSQDVYFDSDSVAIRATFRVGWGLPRPDRTAKITVTV
jgi:HK97 family phage major capsid protein